MFLAQRYSLQLFTSSRYPLLLLPWISPIHLTRHPALHLPIAVWSLARHPQNGPSSHQALAFLMVLALVPTDARSLTRISRYPVNWATNSVVLFLPPQLPWSLSTLKVITMASFLLLDVVLRLQWQTVWLWAHVRSQRLRWESRITHPTCSRRRVHRSHRIPCRTMDECLHRAHIHLMRVVNTS